MKIADFIPVLIVVFTGLMPFSAEAQKDCTVPAAALLTLVSVEPETGFVDLSWNLSPSSDIAAYIIYNHNSGYWIAIDTLWNPAATDYIYNSAGTKYFSESYVVAALRLPVCTSPLSNTLNTIYSTSEIDTCKKQITVKWSRYTAYPKKILDYKILVSKNGAPFSATYTADTLSGSFIINEFEPGTRYCFVVRAELADGSVSNSNKSCIDTKMQRPPLWINADYATVTEENKIDLSFTIDHQSEISKFALEKKTGNESYKSLVEFSGISGSLKYTDQGADIKTLNYYRVAAINNCNMPVVYSNIASNIFLTLKKSDDIIELRWNPYRQWNGTTGAVRLIVYTGDGSSETREIEIGDTSMVINYASIMYSIKGSEVCFSIESQEASNPYGASGLSQSNKVCTSADEVINVPNTFTPDGNLVNDRFRPVLSFTPVTYRLVISDTKRKILFESSDYTEEWDGTSGGRVLPEGTYLWFLKITTPSGKSISRTGIINIILK